MGRGLHAAGAGSRTSRRAQPAAERQPRAVRCRDGRRTERRVAVLRRQPRVATLFAARSDRRDQRRPAQGRVAVRDRQLRSAPGGAQREHAADDRRRAVHAGPASRATSSRSTRRAASCSGSGGRTTAKSASRERRARLRAAAPRTGPTAPATSGCSRSRRASISRRSIPTRGARCPASARTASSIS